MSMKTIYEKHVVETDDDKLIARFTERPAARAARIARKQITSEETARIRRALGI